MLDLSPTRRLDLPAAFRSQRRLEPPGESTRGSTGWLVTLALVEHAALAIVNWRLHARIRRDALRDPLTGLFNRRWLDESLSREIRRATRAGRTVALIMLDLDDFKALNDLRGHQAGDALLRDVARAIRSGIRRGDTACRYGGDEFTLILPGLSKADAARRAVMLREAFGRRHTGDTHSCGVTMSAGVAVYPDDGPTGGAVLLAADDALYRAKAMGRNRVVVSADRW